jgi:hypothetical protein
LGDRAANPDTSGLNVDIFDIKSGQLTEPQAGIGQHQNDVALIPARFR